MAENILSSLFAKASLSIYNQTYGINMAKDLKIKRVMIRLSADPQRHLLENGATFIDTRTIKGIRLQVDVFCPDLDTLNQINAVAMDRLSLYQITSRGLIIPDVMIEAEMLSQSSEVISATPARLSFKQILIQNKSPIVYNNPADASLIDKGLSIIDEAKETVGELYDKTSSAVTEFIG